MIDGLYEAIVLVCNVSVKDTDHAIITTAQKEVSCSWMEVQRGDFIVVFSILPTQLGLSAIPWERVSLVRNLLHVLP